MPASANTTYTVRHSPRAKYARLTCTVAEGLVIVVPPGFDLAQIPSLLKRHQRWLERAMQWVEAQRSCYAPEPPQVMPERLQLLGIGEQWELEYREAQGSRVRVIELAGKLLLFGNPADATAIAAALKGWLAHKAQLHLKPWLLRLARQHGFSVHRVCVRAQRSRWASCSSQKIINLNLKLQFLPPPLVEYTMIHELCHTVYMNHSQQFWELVKACDLDYLAQDQQLKAAWQFVPAWLEAS